MYQGDIQTCVWCVSPTTSSLVGGREALYAERVNLNEGRRGVLVSNIPHVSCNGIDNAFRQLFPLEKNAHGQSLRKFFFQGG